MSSGDDLPKPIQKFLVLIFLIAFTLVAIFIYSNMVIPEGRISGIERLIGNIGTVGLFIVALVQSSAYLKLHNLEIARGRDKAVTDRKIDLAMDYVVSLEKVICLIGAVKNPLVTNNLLATVQAQTAYAGFNNLQLATIIYRWEQNKQDYFDYSLIAAKLVIISDDNLAKKIDEVDKLLGEFDKQIYILSHQTGTGTHVTTLITDLTSYKIDPIKNLLSQIRTMLREHFIYSK